MASMGPDGVNDERAYLGVEIGELAAWITVRWDKTKPEGQQRFRFMAPPTPDEFFRRVAEIKKETFGGGHIAGIGVASRAPVDGAYGMIRAGSLMPEWTDVAITTRLSESLNAPVVLRSGVDAAALAESRFGAGRDMTPMVYAHLGREVLSSLVYDGAPALGAHGGVGQIGHWQVVEDGPRCACGATGHLNSLCSSQGFVRLAIGLVAHDDSALAAVNEATGGRVEALTAPRIVALANSGIEPLRRLVMRAADAMGLALAQFSLAVHPAMIVLGGPLGVAGGLFIERAHERMTEGLRAIPSAGEAPRLVSASLEPQSALTGAWLLANAAAGDMAG